MATYTVNFKSNERTEDRSCEVVTIPDCVPCESRNMAICARLLTMGFQFAADPIILTRAITIHAVECGIPDDVKVKDSIDILA